MGCMVMPRTLQVNNLGVLTSLFFYIAAAVFPSVSVGRPKHVRIMAGAVEGDVFIGRKAQELRGLLKIKYPIEHGIVQDWDDMERIWQYIYSDELKTLSEEVRLDEGQFYPCKGTTRSDSKLQTMNWPKKRG